MLFFWFIKEFFIRLNYILITLSCFFIILFHYKETLLFLFLLPFIKTFPDSTLNILDFSEIFFIELTLIIRINILFLVYFINFNLFHYLLGGLYSFELKYFYKFFNFYILILIFLVLIYFTYFNFFLEWWCFYHYPVNINLFTFTATITLKNYFSFSFLFLTIIFFIQLFLLLFFIFAQFIFSNKFLSFYNLRLVFILFIFVGIILYVPPDIFIHILILFILLIFLESFILILFFINFYNSRLGRVA